MLALSENIRRLRRAAGLSQEELAGRLGVSRQSVSLWEQGETNPTVENICAMTEVLGVSFDELMAEPAEIKPAPEQGTVTARTYDELMQENSPPPNPVTPPISFSNTPKPASDTPNETQPPADVGGMTDRMKAEAQYYRYLHLTRKTRTACRFLLSGGLMMLFAFIMLGSLAVDHAGTPVGAVADALGPICIMMGLSVFAGGLVAAIVFAIRAGNHRRRMGDLFDLATYESLKRGSSDYAAKRK